MNIARAITAFLIAGLVPVVVGLLSSPAPDGSSLTLYVVLSGVVYLYSLPVIFVMGFAAVFFSTRIKYGPFFVPLLIGFGGSVLIGKLSYNAGTKLSDMKMLLVEGTLTALVAASIYFFPEIRKGRSSRNFAKPLRDSA